MRRDFDKELKTALCCAMELEYAKYPVPKELEYEYPFSDAFEKKMKKVCRMANGDYVSFGRCRLRLVTAVFLIAALLFAMTAGAIAGQKLYVKWNEIANAKDGTLDITFDVEDPNQIAAEFQFVKPKTPAGYHIESEIKYGETNYKIKYLGQDGTVIRYSQNANVGTTGVKMDNEDADVQKILVNGCEGYSYQKEESSALMWSDGVSLFQIIGNCEIEFLEDMVKVESSKA